MLFANSELFSEPASNGCCGEDSACVHMYFPRATGEDSSVLVRIIDGGEHMFLDGGPVAGSGGVVGPVPSSCEDGGLAGGPVAGSCEGAPPHPLDKQPNTSAQKFW